MKNFLPYFDPPPKKKNDAGATTDVFFVSVYHQIHDLAADNKDKLCGTYGLFVWASMGNEVKLTLHSDNSTTKSGIFVIYEQTPRPSTKGRGFKNL